MYIQSTDKTKWVIEPTGVSEHTMYKAKLFGQKYGSYVSVSECFAEQPHLLGYENNERLSIWCFEIVIILSEIMNQHITCFYLHVFPSSPSNVELFGRIR